jgi:hypothetical protein
MPHIRPSRPCVYESLLAEKKRKRLTYSVFVVKKEILGATGTPLFSVTQNKNLGLRKVSLPMVAQDKTRRWFVASKSVEGGVRMKYFRTEVAARKGFAELTDPTRNEHLRHSKFLGLHESRDVRGD